MNNSPIGIFDSGSGGLTVLDACRKLMPQESFVYVSDSRPGGWGSLSESVIAERASKCALRLSEYGCKAIVAACNTATEVSIEGLRKTYGVPFVGLEPAIKPAAKAFPDGKITVLCTPATARQSKLKALCEECGRGVRVRAQPSLASLIEKNLDNLDSLACEAERIVEEENPDAIVLGCTHYVFIRYIFESLLSPSRVFDGNDGAAKRLQTLMRNGDSLHDGYKLGSVVFDTI